MSVCIVKHHVRCFVRPIGENEGLYDEFDLAEFDNNLDEFLNWFRAVCLICCFEFDGYELF